MKRSAEIQAGRYLFQSESIGHLGADLGVDLLFNARNDTQIMVRNFLRLVGIAALFADKCDRAVDFRRRRGGYPILNDSLDERSCTRRICFFAGRGVASLVGDHRKDAPKYESEVERLAAKFDKRWPTIVSARRTATEKRAELTRLVESAGGQMRSDMNLVVFGSLARGEWTSRSDLDWSLLIDGQADPRDVRIAKKIEKLLRENNWTPPGRLGAFGSLVFSHGLIHDIGGASDSHSNTTRRILLLLESRAIGDGHVRERVIRCLLERYLEEDTHFHPSNGSRSFVPRFLLNDVIRYWRTIAVDYANKTLEAGGTGWALRNIKLRMSRKLIFVAGLLLCFICHLEQQKITPDQGLFGTDESNLRFIQFLSEQIGKTPLDLLAGVLLQRSIDGGTTGMIFDEYEAFLAAANDPAKRQHLESLSYQAAKKDEVFNEMRAMGKNFQEGLRCFFFEADDEICRLAQVYAIF